MSDTNHQATLTGGFSIHWYIAIICNLPFLSRHVYELERDSQERSSETILAEAGAEETPHSVADRARRRSEATDKPTISDEWPDALENPPDAKYDPFRQENDFVSVRDGETPITSKTAAKRGKKRLSGPVRKYPVHE